MAQLQKGQHIRRPGEVLTLDHLKRKMDVDAVTGCWNWLGGGVDGYGRIGIDGKTHIVHRLAWELVNGLIPEGKLLLHDCDNPRCFNPAHLFVGTHLDNFWDSVKKGRAHCNGFTPEQVVEILASSEATRAVARRLGVNHKTIRDIRAGVNYRWVST